MYCCIPRITVCFPPEGAKTKGHHKSFHTGTIVKTATVANGGRTRGNII